MPSNLRRHWAMILVFLTAGPVYLLTIRDYHRWGGDFSIYVLQARNFAQGRPFQQNTYVVTPASARNHPAAYPPIPSLLLAPVYAARGLDYRAFKSVLSLFYWLSLPLWYGIALRLGLSPPVASFCMFLYAFNASMFPTMDNIGSDGVYLFFSAAAVLAILWTYDRDLVKSSPVLSAGMLAVLLLVCYATRATALALIAALLVYEAFHARRVRPFGIWLVAFLSIAIVLYTLEIYDGRRQYGAQFPFDPMQYARNIVFYLRMPASLWGPSLTPLRYFLAGSMLLLAAMTFLRRLRRPTVIEPYLVIFIGMLVAYTLTQDFRYCLPILPLLLFYAAGAAVRIRYPVAAVLAVASLPALAFNFRTIDTSPVMDGIAQPAFLDTCRFLRSQIPADSLILSWNPRVFALYTDKRSALYPQTNDAPEFEREIPRPGPAYLVFYDRPLDHQKLDSIIAAERERLAIVFENSDYRVYRLPDLR